MNRTSLLGAATAALSLSLVSSTFAASLTSAPGALLNKGDIEPDQTLVLGTVGPEFTDVPVGVAGTGSWDLVGDSSNQVLLVDIAAGAGQPSGTPMIVTGIGWNVSLATVGGSWRTEARFYFDQSVPPGPSGVFLRPAPTTDNSPGVGTYSSGSVVDLTDNGLPDMNLSNGILRIELYESFDDVPDAIDANWTAGNLTIRAEVVPEPASLSLLALSGLLTMRRRR